MANLFFPQLASGTLAQYPIRKTRVTRTVRNELPNGDLVLYADPGADEMVWELGYSGLDQVDINGLANFFNICKGRFHAFTFIDPAENMLVASADLGSSLWSVGSSIQVVGGANDPNGGMEAFTVTNKGQDSQGLSQTLSVPAGYQYCFSVYVMSGSPSAITLSRQGATMQETSVQPVASQWVRVTSSGTLADDGVGFTTGIELAPGQQVVLFGPQLEPQIAPSRFRPTFQSGGVYSRAHWGVDELLISADASNVFSTVFSVESSI